MNPITKKPNARQGSVVVFLSIFATVFAILFALGIFTIERVRGRIMKLDRNVNPDKIGKYALINLRKVQGQDRKEQIIDTGDYYLIPKQAVEWGDTLSDEFFIIKLKDKYAAAALSAYAIAAQTDDPEYAAEVRTLAERAGPHHLLCKRPD